MAKPDPVQLADPRADHPRPARLALIAFIAAGAGLAIAFGVSQALSGPRVAALAARGSLANPPPEAAPEPEVEHSSSQAPSDPPATTLASAGVPSAARPLPSEAPAESGAVEPAAAPSSGPAETRSPSPAETAAPADASATSPQVQERTKRTFDAGLVAYVRCEGSEIRGARFPCPRDRKLEEHVWHVLAQLPHCTEADPGTGAAELRLTLNKTRISVDFRAPASGPSLDLRAVSTCAGEKLAAARTPASLPHAVVSFRFGLQ